MSERLTVKDEIQRALRRLTIATILIYTLLGGTVAAMYVSTARTTAHISSVALSTNAALCTLRFDLEQRIASTRKFLADNPNGIPGISAAAIQQGITNQERTIDALSSLEC